MMYSSLSCGFLPNLSGKRRNLRALKISELFAIWEYEGKLPSKSYGPKLAKSLLSHWLKSPPAKSLHDSGYNYNAFESFIPTTVTPLREIHSPSG
jgi:hypothetical protein